MRFYSSQVFFVSQIGKTSKHCYLSTVHVRVPVTKGQSAEMKVVVQTFNEKINVCMSVFRIQEMLA